MKKLAIHFAGGGEYKTSSQYHIMLRGWAYCCSGYNAINIKENGNYTYKEEEVTCKKCRSNIEKSVFIQA